MQTEVITGVYDPPFMDTAFDDDDAPEYLTC
jgi:hypothetical protein